MFSFARNLIRILLPTKRIWLDNANFLNSLASAILLQTQTASVESAVTSNSMPTNVSMIPSEIKIIENRVDKLYKFSHTSCLKDVSYFRIKFFQCQTLIQPVIRYTFSFTYWSIQTVKTQDFFNNAWVKNKGNKRIWPFRNIFKTNIRILNFFVICK